MKNSQKIRITSGELKNKTIESPAGNIIHPMGSRERMALMNIIGPEIQGASVLDVFAGTGAIGIEALSRGAKYVTFVEKKPKVAAVLKNNLKNLGLSEKSKVIIASADRVFEDEYDFVIADPPYDEIASLSVEIFKNLAKIAKNRFFLSHPENFDLTGVDAKLADTKKYAAARISIFTKS